MYRRHVTSTHVISTIVATALLSLPLSLSPASAQTSASTACGNPPSGYNVIETDNRFITGTPGRDFICAGDSNNIIRAKGQDDIIFGGGGNDVIWGGYGNDTVWAGDGDDLVNAGGGRDVISAGSGEDTVFGGTGADTIRGGNGADKLTGGEGHDTFDGGDGADTLVGNKGVDTMSGGDGDDIVQGGIGADNLAGGSGDDVLTGGDHEDVLSGGDGDDRLLGGDGTDALTGGNGDDSVFGGANADVLRGSAGNDLLDGGNGLNLAVGGAGSDDCMNVDDRKSECEVIDGISTISPAAQIWMFVPSTESLGTLVGGTHWGADAEIDILLLNNAGEAVGPATTTVSDEDGRWQLIMSAADLNGRTILVSDRSTELKKTLKPAIDSFTWDRATDRIEVVGNPNELVKAQAFFPDASGDLVFVEQIKLGEDGTAAANFDDVRNIGSLQLRRLDGDGDVEIHADVDSGTVTVMGPAATVVTLNLEPVKK